VNDNSTENAAGLGIQALKIVHPSIKLEFRHQSNTAKGFFEYVA